MRMIELVKQVEDASGICEKMKELDRYLQKPKNHFNGGLRIRQEAARGGNTVIVVSVDMLRVYNVANIKQQHMDDMRGHLVDLLEPTTGYNLDEMRVRSVEYCRNLPIDDRAVRAELVAAMQDAILPYDSDVWVANVYDNATEGLSKKLWLHGDTSRPRPYEKDMAIITNTVKKGRVTEESERLHIAPTWGYWASEKMEKRFMSEAAALILKGMDYDLVDDDAWGYLLRVLGRKWKKLNPRTA
jgi:hypothetical protein